MLSILSKLSNIGYFGVMFDRKKLKDIGNLSEDYGLGMFEDDDHCKKILKKGFSIKLAEDSFIHHELSASFSKIDEKKRTELFEKNKKIYEKKWGKWIAHKYRQIRPSPTIDLR